MEKKRTIIHWVICVGLVCLIWGGYLCGMKILGRTIASVREDGFSWVMQIDEVKIEEKEFVLEGFAFKLNREAEKNSFDIVLHNLNADEYFFPKMEYLERKDVNDYFICEYDYTMSGFVARIEEEKLNLVEDDYEVLLCPKGTRSPYRFATYLVDGKLMHVNPKEYVMLDVEGTDLEEIVENGVLIGYEPEHHIYIYQLEKSLFWIVNNRFDFEEDGSTYFEFQMNTTQTERLPKERQENGWLWGNEGFVFEENELEELGLDTYRCAKYVIPADYSVTKIWTGYYKEKWIWIKEFRPRYGCFQ